MYIKKFHSKPKIFISSTFEDFKELRSNLFSEAQKINQDIDAMEFFGAQAGEPIKICLKRLESCDIYIGIIGRKYGTVDTKTGKSYTQCEYEHAKKLHKKKKLRDIWIYLPSPDCKFPVKHTENDAEKLTKLEEFIRIVSTGNFVEFYNDTDDLKHKIVVSILTKIKRGLSSLSNNGESEYDKYLDASYDIISIEGINFAPSLVLKTMDEEAYRQGFLEWQDSQDLSNKDAGLV